MAVNFSVDHNRTSEYSFRPEDIEIRPELRGRTEKPDINELIASIVSLGQLEPVLIRSDGGKPVLVAGFSRHEAITEINRSGLTPVPLKIRCTYFRGNERDAFLANIAENRVRKATTPIDDANNIARLERYGMSQAEIAKHYSESERWVRDRLSLISLTPAAQEAVRAGDIQTTAAIEMARLPEAQQAEMVEKAKAGEQIDRASVRAAKSGGQKKASLAEVRLTLETIDKEGKLPGDLERVADPFDQAVLLAQYLLGLITGKSKKSE